MQKLYAWAIVLLVSIGQLYAQQARIIYTPTTTPGARMAASDSPIIGIQGQQIGTTMKLRWIPANDSTGTIWQQGITNGYIVKRKITYRNGSPVANATFQTLATVKPADQNSSVWSDTNADNATYHDAAKKLLYAYEDMALKDRYPYFIWVTTYSYAAAVKGGVGYIDNSLQTGDSCVYTVEIANTSIKSSELFNRQALRAIPAPATPGVKFLPRALDDSAKNANQRYVRIESKIDTSRTDYVAYSIERSVNNSAFSRINPELIILFNTDNKSKTELTYNDTIPNNRSTYSYRIIGKTIFDENITSVTQTQTAKLPLSVTPVMDSVKVFDNRAANLYWHYINNQGVSIAQSSDIGAQIIQYSRKADLGFGKDMTVTSLSSMDRIKQSLLQYDNQYYRIGAIGIDGDTLFSRAMLGQYVDKIPPKSPASVLVKWNNSEKKPEISWASNQEEDLAGYRVYRKNSDAEQPVQITPFVYVGTPYPGRTTYQDTTTFRVAGMVLKYFVAAEDKKGNLSGRSELMSVVVPDMAKPSPAIFISDSINTSKPFIYLNWRNSPSADVRKHTLYRAELPDGTFFTKLTYTNLINEYIDNDVAFGKRYVYSIIAEDTTLLSMSSTPRIIQMPNAPAEPFTSFKAQYQLSTKSINLDWQYPSPDQVASYEIYRAEGGASIPTTWALVSAPSAGTQDASVKVGTGYKYQIRAILKSGALTSWTNLEILFPDNLCIDGQASISNKGVAAATTITKQEACEEVILEPGFEARPQTSGSYEATIKK